MSYNVFLDANIDSSWAEKLKPEFSKPYFRSLENFVTKEYETQIVYPPSKLIFQAFNDCPFDKVKVVIIGQDPYHGVNQANGLCFSVQDGVKIPPSLKNIFKELSNDLHVEPHQSGNLECWARQGVLLLNSILTVRAAQPESHRKKGWEQFTDCVIELLSKEKKHLVFLLWGAYAQRKGNAIDDQSSHLILHSVHPSPLSANRGFFGSRPFSKTNDYLIAHGISPINW